MENALKMRKTFFFKFWALELNILSLLQPPNLTELPSTQLLVSFGNNYPKEVENTSPLSPSSPPTTRPGIISFTAPNELKTHEVSHSPANITGRLPQEPIFSQVSLQPPPLIVLLPGSCNRDKAIIKMCQQA